MWHSMHYVFHSIQESWNFQYSVLVFLLHFRCTGTIWVLLQFFSDALCSYVHKTALWVWGLQVVGWVMMFIDFFIEVMHFSKQELLTVTSTWVLWEEKNILNFRSMSVFIHKVKSTQHHSCSAARQGKF